MPSEMLVRVTKAIHDAMDVTDGLDSTAAATYARAAIASMREPTNDMVQAAWASAHDEDAKGAWQEMIDAALSD